MPPPYTDRMPPPAVSLLTRVRDRGLLPAWIGIIALWRAAAGDHTEAMWMSREGAAVLDGAPLVHPDTWGWAPQAWDFIPTSPGWELLSALAWRTFGTAGFAVLAFAVTATTLGVLSWVARSLGASRIATIAALIFTSALANGILTSRAGLPAFTLLIAEFMTVWSLRDRLRASSTGRATATLMAIAFAFAYLGIWLHGSWTLFALIAAGGTAMLMLSHHFGTPRRRLGLAVGTGLASLLATLVGPLGPSVWANTLRVGAECRGLVKEWTSPWVLGSIWPSMWLLMAAVLVLGAVGDVLLRSRAGWHPLHVVMLTLAVGAVTAGAFAIRFLLLGIIAATPLLALWITRTASWHRLDPARRVLGERAQEPYWRNIAAILAVVVLPLAAIDAAATPWSPDTVVTALPSACNLFSDDYDAKPVEFWRPDVRVWVDGRQDYWGRERILVTNRYKAGKVANELVPAGTTCVLLQTAEQHPLARALDASAEWMRVKRNAQLTLWVLRAD